MTEQLDETALRTLFTEARTHGVWHDRQVSDDLLIQIYNIAKMGPTSANCSPARFVFVRTAEENTATGAYPSQSRKNHEGASDRDRGLRQDILRCVAYALPTYRRAILVRVVAGLGS